VRSSARALLYRGPRAAIVGLHPTDPRRNVTVPMHNEDLKRGTLRGIIAQAGFSVTDFLKLL
jgi:hypothetical protein